MPGVKINFVDFWEGFDRNDNYFVNSLKGKVDFEIAPDPDILFFSYFGQSHLQFNCHKIQYLGENVAPDFRLTDYALSFDYLNHPNHLRLPLYAMCFDQNRTVQKTFPPISRTMADELLNLKLGFCSFVVSSRGTPSRIDFFKRLSQYKKVDSGGALLNNIGSRVGNKLEFIRKYKFNIAFENASYPGYVTEKLIEAKQAVTVPIYWGSPCIAEEMNPKSFISYHDYNSFQKFLDAVIAVDNDDEIYKTYLQEPLFHNNEPNEYLDTERFVNFFKKILTEISQTSPVSTSSKFKLFSLPLYYRATLHRKRKTVIKYKPDW